MTATADLKSNKEIVEMSNPSMRIVPFLLNETRRNQTKEKQTSYGINRSKQLVIVLFPAPVRPTMPRLDKKEEKEQQQNKKTEKTCLHQEQQMKHRATPSCFETKRTRSQKTKILLMAKIQEV
jgi:uncharacterized transporter YbjL